MAAITLTNATISVSAASGSVIGTFNVSGLQVLKTDPKVSYFSVSGKNLIGKWISPPAVGSYNVWVFAVNSPPATFKVTITAAAALPTPASVTLTPASVSVPDNSAAGLSLSQATVKMSDSSTFSGALSLSASPFAAIASGKVVLSRGLTAADDGAKSLVVTATQNSKSASATLALTVTAAGPVISPDGTTSTAPSGASLTTAAGNWTWGPAVSGRPGEYQINLNGAWTGTGILIEAANGGQLYANTASLGWYLWNSGWSQSPGPNPPPRTLILSFSPSSPQVPDNSTVGTVITTVTVKYPDGTPPASVTLTSSDTTFVKVQGMQLVLARAMTPADDGTHSVTITASDGLGALATARLFGGAAGRGDETG
jgi:hypothetical protein